MNLLRGVRLGLPALIAAMSFAGCGSEDSTTQEQVQSESHRAGKKPPKCKHKHDDKHKRDAGCPIDAGMDAADAPSDDASLDAGNSDAPSTDAAGDAQDAGSDAQDPASCLPPCLRRALEPCLPALDSCLFEHVPGTPDWFKTDTTCAPDANWSSTYEVGYHFESHDIVQNGATCYRDLMQWGIGLSPYTRYFDASGAQVAFGQYDQQNAQFLVWCTASLPPGVDDPVYTLDASCPIPTDRCSQVTPGSCP